MHAIKVFLCLCVCFEHKLFYIITELFQRTDRELLSAGHLGSKPVDVRPFSLSPSLLSVTLHLK